MRPEHFCLLFIVGGGMLFAAYETKRNQKIKEAFKWAYGGLALCTFGILGLFFYCFAEVVS